MQTLWILALLFSAIAMSGGLAHLFALPNKIGLGERDYFTVQQIYRGWALFGIPILLALITTASLIAKLRHDPAFRWTVVAFAAIAATQVIFWMYTYPANRATQNWTTVPANWEALRTQWEYSHAFNALLNVVAFLALTVSAVRGGR